MLDGIDGGVGWPDYDDVIQWSADSTRVGLSYSTNQVGVFDPFATETSNTEPLASAGVTDGASRPPRWLLAPDGRSAYVAVWSPTAIKGCVAPLEAGDLYWLPGDAPASHPYLLGGPLPEGAREDGVEVTGWSQDGTRLHGHDARGKRLVIDPATKEVCWAREDDEPAGPRFPAATSGTGGPSVKVSVEETRVAFRGAGDVLLGDVVFLREPPGDPLLGDDYSTFDEVNFALDDDTWCAVFEEGVVIAPPVRAARPRRTGRGHRSTRRRWTTCSRR